MSDAWTAGQPTAGEPDASVRRLLEGLWCRVLQVDHVDPQVGFFDLGATSLMLVEVLSALRERWPSMKMVDLLGHPTVKELEAFLRQQPEASG
jgi:aryl carrier-like protein